MDDLETLVELSRRTFSETFASQNSAENIQLYLKKNLSTGVLKAELEYQDSEFYFVERDGERVGYMKIKYNSFFSGSDDLAHAELERLYIDKQMQGLGLGKKLMDKAIALTHESGFDVLWLGVWEYNEKAINFYERLGFVRRGEHTFMLGKDPQRDIIMLLNLSVK